MESILSQIKTGREGWVYLIHAVGTKRYKIGRSVNPIARLEVLKGQSPYPLKVIWSEWTVDAIEDEKRAHQSLKEYRVYGEWFELEEFDSEGRRYGTSLDDAVTTLDFGGVMNELKREGFKACCCLLGANDATETPEGAMTVYELYSLADSVAEVNKIRYFLLNQLPTIYHQYWVFAEPTSPNKYQEQQGNFLCGALHTFALTVLGKERRYRYE